MEAGSESTCKNCGAAASQSFCPRCGQSTRSPRRPVGEITAEFVDAYFFSLDSKLTRSLVSLVAAPGKLTKQFLGGQRKSQLPPLRMHLFLLIAVFFSLNLVGKFDASQVEVRVAGELIGAEKGSARRVIHLFQFDPGSLPMRLFSDAIGQQAKKLQSIQDPQVLLDLSTAAMEAAMPNVVMFSVPLTAWVLWLLYRRQRRHYFDHLIFVLHAQSTMFLALLIAGAGLWIYRAATSTSSDLDGVVVNLSLPFLLPALVVAMRRVYGQSLAVTLLKAALLLGYYVVLFSLTGELAAALGLMAI